MWESQRNIVKYDSLLKVVIFLFFLFPTLNTNLVELEYCLLFKILLIIHKRIKLYIFTGDCKVLLHMDIGRHLNKHINICLYFQSFYFSIVNIFTSWVLRVCSTALSIFMASSACYTESSYLTQPWLCPHCSSFSPFPDTAFQYLICLSRFLNDHVQIVFRKHTSYYSYVSEILLYLHLFSLLFR